MIYRIDDEPRPRPGLGVRRSGSSSSASTILLPARLPRARALPLHDRRRSGSCCCWRRGCPGSARRSTAPTSSVNIGPLAFQPAEFAKICIVIFLASYLREKREVLVVGARRVLGVTLPPLKHFGPLLVVWGAAMLMLVFIRDLGSSLMFFGAFLALLYVATGRFSFVVIGMVMFLVGACVHRLDTIRHVHDRVDIWLDPFARNAPEGAGQILQSMFAQADGGLFGQGLGESLLKLPGPFAPDCAAAVPRLRQHPARAAHRLHLRRDRRASSASSAPAGVILIYALIAARGFKTAVMAAGRLLEAARDRADRGLRAPGVRDHRRRHQGDPADRRDAAVRLLRRQLGRRQHDPARAAAADLRPRPPAADRAADRPGRPARGCRREPPDRPPLRPRPRCCSRCSSASPRTGRCSTPTRSRTRPRTAAR